jgi:hypothetical protein
MITIEMRGMRAVQTLPVRMRRGAERGLDKVAKKGLYLKRANIRRPTYTRAIPRTSTGRPRWVRTGSWKDGQVIRNNGAFGRVIQTSNVSKARRYEPYLANLPTSKYDGINRSNPAAERTMPELEAAAPGIIANEIARAMK